MMGHSQDTWKNTKKEGRRSQDAAPMLKETPSNLPSASSSSSGASRADGNVQHRQESNDGVREQDADVNTDDKEEQSPTEEKSHVNVIRNRETGDDADRDSKRQRLSSIATHPSEPQHARVSKFLEHVNGGELSLREDAADEFGFGVGVTPSSLTQTPKKNKIFF